MKIKRLSAFAIAVILLLSFVSCADHSAPLVTSTPFISASPLITPTPLVSPSPTYSTAHIYLYGEEHTVEKILDKELETWRDYYDNENMRHLFIEYSYYTAEFLNLWMQSDNDDILEALYADWDGTLSHDPLVKEFFKSIKADCPETVFHGTDIGHQYSSTGERFLKYLKDTHLENTEQYTLTEEAIEQGKYSYENNDWVYRENTMAENFIREFDKLGGESVMGIYGAAHTGLEALDFTGAVPCMANQLKAVYGDAISSEDLTWLAKDTEPTRVDTITVNGKDYEASYFGRQDQTEFEDYVYLEFWRLENAYEDFKDSLKTGVDLPFYEYPMLIEDGQVFVIKCIKRDGTSIRRYFISDGYVSDGVPSTEEFTVG